MIEPIFSYDLHPRELEIWNKIQQMEAVHNELGANLSAYRDSIMEYRNVFVASLAKKYGIDKPSDCTIDPVTRKIVSIFHPGAGAHRIVNRPHAFKQVAFQCIQDSIKKLGEIFDATHARG